eukprot:299857_1
MSSNTIVYVSIICGIIFVICIVIIMVVMCKRKTVTNNINAQPIVETQNVEQLDQYDSIPTGISQHQILCQKVASNTNIPMDDIDDTQNVSASSDIYEIHENQNEETNGKNSKEKHEQDNDNEVNQVEGPVNRGQADDEYVDIINVLRECDDVEWKRYLDNFKKNKSNDKRLKKYWLQYSDEEWQQLIPEFGLRYQFKDLWGEKLKNHHHKITEKDDSNNI